MSHVEQEDVSLECMVQGFSCVFHDTVKTDTDDTVFPLNEPPCNKQMLIAFQSALEQSKRDVLQEQTTPNANSHQLDAGVNDAVYEDALLHHIVQHDDLRCIYLFLCVSDAVREVPGATHVVCAGDGHGGRAFGIFGCERSRCSLKRSRRKPFKALSKLFAV